jgi:hypothetical protein
MIRVQCEIEKLALGNLHQTLLVPEDITPQYLIATKTVVDRGNALQYLEHAHPVTHQVLTIDAIQLRMNAADGEAQVLVQDLEVPLESLC